MNAVEKQNEAIKIIRKRILDECKKLNIDPNNIRSVNAIDLMGIESIMISINTFKRDIMTDNDSMQVIKGEKEIWAPTFESAKKDPIPFMKITIPTCNITNMLGNVAVYNIYKH